MRKSGLTASELVALIDEDTIKLYRIEARKTNLMIGLKHIIHIQHGIFNLDEHDGAYHIRNDKINLTLLKKTKHTYLTLF